MLRPESREPNVIVEPATVAVALKATGPKNDTTAFNVFVPADGPSVQLALEFTGSTPVRKGAASWVPTIFLKLPELRTETLLARPRNGVKTRHSG